MEQNERNKNLSLKKKLFISHGIIIATAAVIAVLLLVGLNIVKGNVSGIFNGPLANIDSVGKVRYGITDLQRAINRILTEDSSQVGNSYVNFEKTVTEDVSLITDSVQQMHNRKMNTESTALLNQIASKIDEGEKVRSTLMTQIKAGRYSEAVELNNNTYLPIVNDIKSLSEQLENSIDKTAVNYYTMSKYWCRNDRGRYFTAYRRRGIRTACYTQDGQCYCRTGTGDYRSSQNHVQRRYVCRRTDYL